MRRLEPILRRAFAGPCALPAGSRLLVALSGGADSTALLLAVRRLTPKLQFEPVAAHLHHGLRGAEADGDLAFVRDLCARLDVPLVHATWDTRRRMRTRGLAGQAGLRVLRREFLAGAARGAGAAAIATAHTADDQLETVLMRLLRGAGLTGLGGMRPRRGSWLKPFILATRAEIEADLRDAGQTWRDDRSNLDPIYLRNRLRHDVIPALVRAGGAAGDGPTARARLARRVARSVAEVRGAADAFDRWSLRTLSTVSRIQAGEIALDSRRTASYPFTARRILLRQLWKRLAPSSPGLTHHHLEALGRLLACARGGASVDLPAGWVAEREGASIFFRHRERRVTPGAERVALPARRTWKAGTLSGGWTTGATARRRLVDGTGSREFFAADAIEGRLELRPASVDEWFVPFGRRQPTRLGRFLSKQRRPGGRKFHPTVLADAQGILWVVGVRRSARAPITPVTRKALWVRREPHD